MTYSPEKLIETNKATVQAFEDLSSQLYTSFEKLIDLNLASSKAILGESFSHARSALDAKDMQELLDLQAGLYKSLVAEKSVAYSQHIYNLANGTSSEFTKAFDERLSGMRSAFTEMMDNLTKNFPAGTETALAAFKGAMNVSQNVIESAQSSAKKAVEVAESSFVNVTEQATNAATASSKKR